jgi:outer membrane protein OmpA-like peptidoglycan-associated protein
MAKKYISIGIALCLVLTLGACAYQNQQQRGTAVGAGLGAVAGAIVGQAAGGDTEATLLGAAIGATVGGIAGNQIGAYMDRQEAALRNAMAASQAASIQREQNILTATFKGDVFFGYDSATLLPGGITEVSNLARVLNQYPQTMIRVEGHTDTQGSETYNQALSERRAQAVTAALVQQGVAQSRIRTVGYGESQPISSDHAANRRVEVVIEPVVAQG